MAGPSLSLKRLSLSPCELCGAYTALVCLRFSSICGAAAATRLLPQGERAPATAAGEELDPRARMPPPELQLEQDVRKPLSLSLDLWL